MKYILIKYSFEVVCSHLAATFMHPPPPPQQSYPKNSPHDDPGFGGRKMDRLRRRLRWESTQGRHWLWSSAVTRKAILPWVI